jgi:magnesium-transporting ATPase (P-type)
LRAGSNIECDESAATGESDMVKKGYTAKHDPFFISGAQVCAALLFFSII